MNELSWLDYNQIPHDIDTWNPHTLWKKTDKTHNLDMTVGWHVPNMGRTVSNKPLIINIAQESAGGVGPHFSGAGGTGSGKSFLLQQAIANLVVQYSPKKLNLILGDFKSGNAFNVFKNLPHVIATMSSLDYKVEPDNTERVFTQLSAELQRRIILFQTNNISDITQWNEFAFKKSNDYEQMPEILVIIDEVETLSNSDRDNETHYLETLKILGTMGRSYGLHFGIFSQRMNYRVAGDILNNITVGLALRCDRESSYNVIQSADATQLIKNDFIGIAEWYSTDGTSYEKFKAMDIYASLTSQKDGSHLVREEDWVLTHVVNRIIETTPRVDRQLLPSLNEPITYSTSLVTAPMSETVFKDEKAIYIGEIDDAFHNYRLPAKWNFTTSPNNLMLIGDPKSGKSTAIKNIVASSSLTHPATSLSYHIIEFGEKKLADIENSPNVGTSVAFNDKQGINRIIGEFERISDYRRKTMEDNNLQTFDEYLTYKQQHPTVYDPYNRLVLIMTGVTELRSKDIYLLSMIRTTVENISLYENGINIIMSVEEEFELSLINDDFEKLWFRTSNLSCITDDKLRDAIKQIPEMRPGQFVSETITNNLPARIVLPIFGTIEPKSTLNGKNVWEKDADYSERIVDTIEKHTIPYNHSALEIVPVKTDITWKDVINLRIKDTSRGDLTKTMPMGIDKQSFQPVYVPWGRKANNFLIITGGRNSGKTTALRTVISNLQAFYYSNTAVVGIMDNKIQLLGEYEHLEELKQAAGFAVGKYDVNQAFEKTLKVLKDRLPKPKEKLTPRELRDGTWWEGPDYVFLIDDYTKFTPSKYALNEENSSFIDELAYLIDTGYNLGIKIVVTIPAKNANIINDQQDKLLSVLMNEEAPILMLGDVAGSTKFSLKKNADNIISFKTRPVGEGVLYNPNDEQSPFHVIQVPLISPVKSS